MKNRYTTIAERIKYLFSTENINSYEFCKLEDMLKSWHAFERALTKGNPNNISPKFINAVYKRYKNITTMLWIMTGDDDETVTRYLDRIKELENKNLIVSDAIKKSYAEITMIVDKAEAKGKPKSKKK